MRSMQSTLINYSVISMFYGLANECDSTAFISSAGIIHTERMLCSVHNIPCHYNGSNDSGNIISRSVSSFFKKGQQYCKLCNKTYQVENELIDRIKEDLNTFLVGEILALREIHTSYPDIMRYLKKTKGIVISEKTVEHICNAQLSKYDNLEIDYGIEDGFYCYDEQWVKVNGKKMLRVVILDPKTQLPIYEEKHETLTKKQLEDILKKVFRDTAPKGFVFDMLPMYPNAFTRVFGKKIKNQLCLFHLNQLILKEYRDCLRIGKKVKWTLTDYYNIYTLFNIFYDRTQELDILKNAQKNLAEYKQKVNASKNIGSFLIEGDFPKSRKTDEEKKTYLIHLYEKNHMKMFREHLHKEKLRRKREKVTLEPRSKECAQLELSKILGLISFYPKKIQERIKKIDEKFDLFTASEGEIMTNNKLEGFFGRTLKKFRKKGFHSDKGLQNFLTFQKIKQKGIEIVERVSLCNLGNIFSILALFVR